MTSHVSTETETAFREAKSQQTWGTSTSAVDAATGQSLINIITPPEMARAWTVNLNKQRYRSGTPGTASSVVGDLDSQFSIDAKVRLQWGVDGALEIAEIDYPVSGCTFQIHASTVQLSLVPGTVPRGGDISTYPTIGAWLSPSQRGNTSGDRYPSATWTSPELLFDGLDNVVLFQSRPARAIAYRIVVATDAGATAPLAIYQRTGSPGGGNVAAIDFNRESLTSGDGDYWLHREDWIPLMYNAAGVELHATGVAFVFRVQWLLDLG